MATNFNDMREQMAGWLKGNGGEKLWDVITCLRGPDTPSERDRFSPEQNTKLYAARRARKAKTVEVIRFHAFGGVVGGSARSRSDRNYVELPPRNEWDHFDKHVERAAHALGLEVRIEGERKKVKGEVKLQVEKVMSTPADGQPYPFLFKFKSKSAQEAASAVANHQYQAAQKTCQGIAASNLVTAADLDVEEDDE